MTGIRNLNFKMQAQCDAFQMYEDAEGLDEE